MKKHLLLSLLALSPVLHADEAALNLEALDQRLKIAERKLELAADNTTTPKSGDATTSAGPGGFSISSADKKYALRFGALLQVDSRNYLNDDKAPGINNLLVRRARFIEQATLDRVKLNLVWDLAASALVDGFADIRMHDWVTLRLGQFKTPISLENWRSDPARDFVEAGFSFGLATVRDRGAWLELADPDKAFSLGGGIVNGGIDGATVSSDTSDDKDAVGKLFLHPARFFSSTLLRDFGIGVAASSGHRVPGIATATYLSTGQQSVTSYVAGTTVQDQSFRIAPQAYLYWGPYSFLSEYIRSTDFGTNTANTVDRRTGILAREAWQVQAGWVLTGEDASFNGLAWNKETSNSNWGVWQLVGRCQGFQVDASNVSEQPVDGPTVDATRQRFVNPRSSATKIQGWGLGLNWLPQANSKVYLDFEQNIFTDGAFQNASGLYNTAAAAKTIDRETENTISARAQFTF